MNETIRAPVYDRATVAQLMGDASLGQITRLAASLMFIEPPPEALDGYVTFYDPGLSIDVLATFAGAKPVFSEQRWYTKENKARSEDPPGYRQLRMEAVSD